jgi:predicted MFS family arabinose efflux permease
MEERRIMLWKAVFELMQQAIAAGTSELMMVGLLAE